MYQHERFPSSPISQLRGLRQGDPISPILFNLAFESLLRRIISNPTFRDFSLPRSSFSHPSDLNLQQIKLLTYADDMVCLLRGLSDLHDLQTHLAVYSRAFNAKINFHKALAISLSGALLSNSESWRRPLLENHVAHRHGCSATLPTCYLVFPLPAFTAQRGRYLLDLLTKIQNGCQIRTQRSLSVRGRATVLNSLLLSKLWHVLRVTFVPDKFFKKLRSVMSAFLIHRIFPKISMSTMFLSRILGGLGVLELCVQQCALQL